MPEIDGLVALVVFAFWIWALLDVIATDGAVCRNLNKGVWLVLVVFVPFVGALAWLLMGRPEKGAWRPGSTDYAATRRPIAMEDHPRYGSTPAVTDRRSAELDRELEAWEAEQRAKQTDLDRREHESDT